MKSKLKHLAFTVICIIYIEMIHSAPVTPPVVYGANMDAQGSTIDPIIVKTIIEGIIAVVHIIVSIRKDRREREKNIPRALRPDELEASTKKENE